MNLGKTLFAQIMEFVPWTSFARIIERYGGDVRVRNLRCPEQPRRIRFKDPESVKTLVFLTNNTTLPALTIAALYKSRWQ